MSAFVITAIVIAYVFIAGIVIQLCERSKSDWLELLSLVAGMFWPLILPVCAIVAIGYVLAYRAPNLVIERTIERAKRSHLPRAKVQVRK